MSICTFLFSYFVSLSDILPTFIFISSKFFIFLPSVISIFLAHYRYSKNLLFNHNLKKGVGMGVLTSFLVEPV